MNFFEINGEESFLDFLYEKQIDIITNVLFFSFMDLFLFSKGISLVYIFMINFYFFILQIILVYIEFYKIKYKFEKIILRQQKLDKKYLIFEIMKIEGSILDNLYKKINKTSLNDMLSEVSKIKRERNEYKEYIEKWVHEVKTPIAAGDLIINNLLEINCGIKGTLSEIKDEFKKVDRLVEQALFFARSESVEKDYLIKEFNIGECINNIIIKNKRLFILNNISLDIQDINININCDEKWVDFILSQIIFNSIKYRNQIYSEIKIWCEVSLKRKMIVIQDNGIGIDSSDITRVFEKGFTGSNRGNKNSTGIGLYLSKKLCDKLGLQIKVISEKGKYTRCELIFPSGNFVTNDMF